MTILKEKKLLIGGPRLIIRILFIVIAVALSVLFTYNLKNFYIYPISVFIISLIIIAFEILIKRFQREHVSKIFKGFIIRGPG